MSLARRARLVTATVACTVAAAGCRSPLHGLADVAKRAEPEAVATVDRKEVPEPAPAVASEPPPSPAEPVEPVATPLLDAALRRAEEAEQAEGAAEREALAAVRRNAEQPSPPPPVVTDAPEPEPEPEPSTLAGVEVAATPEPAAESPASAPRTDPAVLPASSESVADLIPEIPAETASPQPAPETVAEPAKDAEADAEEPAPGLTIDAIRLCRKIRGFGSYDPLGDRTLRPGRSALVYCELSGLEYHPDGDGFAARVATRVELIRPDDGAKVWEVADGAVDRGPARRRDVYVGTMITLPDSVPPGEYALRLYQADATSGRSASAEIPVTIAR